MQQRSLRQRIGCRSCQASAAVGAAANQIQAAKQRPPDSSISSPHAAGRSYWRWKAAAFEQGVLAAPSSGDMASPRRRKATLCKIAKQKSFTALDRGSNVSGLPANGAAPGSTSKMITRTWWPPAGTAWCQRPSWRRGTQSRHKHKKKPS